MTKFAKDENDSIRILNGTIAKILVDNDLRIRKRQNREDFKKILQIVVEYGFIRTHTIIANWLIELFEQGEVSTKTFHELIKDLPWSWDTTKEYIDSLKQLGIIRYSRDSQGRKVCSLNLEKETIAKQLMNLVEFYKRKGLVEIMKIMNARGHYIRYYSKLSEWFNKKTTAEQLSKKIIQAPTSTVDRFIHKVTTFICGSKEDELRKNLLELIKKKPLLLRSLERVE